MLTLSNLSLLICTMGTIILQTHNPLSAILKPKASEKQVFKKAYRKFIWWLNLIWTDVTSYMIFIYFIEYDYPFVCCRHTNFLMGAAPVLTSECFEKCVICRLVSQKSEQFWILKHTCDLDGIWSRDWRPDSLGLSEVPRENHECEVLVTLRGAL